MKPDRWDKVIDKIHEDLGYDKKFIKDFMKFYWKKVRMAIMDTKHYRVKADGFGTFMIRLNKAAELKTKLEDIIASLPVDTITNYKKRAAVEEQLKNLETALGTAAKDKEKLIQIAIKRYGKYTPRVEK